MATSSRMMKKASSVITVINTTPYRNYNSAVFITPLKTTTINTSTNLFREVFRTTSIPTYHHFCALAKKRSHSDDTLLSIIGSEIVRAKEEFNDLEVAEIPVEFPFKIEDNPEDKIVTLTREYQGEEIKLIVQTPYVSHVYLDENEKRIRKKFKNSQQFVDISVIVTKQGRPTIRFRVVANDADLFAVISLALENPNATSEEDIPYYRPLHLDENLKAGFYPYLEVRGIKPSITKFLYNYMVRKEHTKYTGWMKNLKNFIAY